MAQSPAVLQPHDIHIALQLRQLDGAPINYLRTHDFHVTAGQPHAGPAYETGSAFNRCERCAHTPTRSCSRTPYSKRNRQCPQAARHAASRLPRRLADRARAADGGFTGYAANELDIQTAQANILGKSTFEQAIATLKTFKGRRLVFYVSDGSGADSRRLRQAASDVEAMLYEIGGNPSDNYAYDGQEAGPAAFPIYGAGLYGAYSGPPGAVGMTVVDPTAAYSHAIPTLFINDVHVERSLRAALKDALRDAQNYYDLRLEVNPATPTLTLRIALKTAYRIVAQAYAEGNYAPPELNLIQPNR